MATVTITIIDGDEGTLDFKAEVDPPATDDGPDTPAMQLGSICIDAMVKAVDPNGDTGFAEEYDIDADAEEEFDTGLGTEWPHGGPN